MVRKSHTALLNRNVIGILTALIALAYPFLAPPMSRNDNALNAQL